MQNYEIYNSYRLYYSRNSFRACTRARVLRPRTVVRTRAFFSRSQAIDRSGLPGVSSDVAVNGNNALSELRSLRADITNRENLPSSSIHLSPSLYLYGMPIHRRRAVVPNLGMLNGRTYTDISAGQQRAIRSESRCALARGDLSVRNVHIGPSYKPPSSLFRLPRARLLMAGVSYPPCHRVETLTETRTNSETVGRVAAYRRRRARCPLLARSSTSRVRLGDFRAPRLHPK